MATPNEHLRQTLAQLADKTQRLADTSQHFQGDDVINGTLRRYRVKLSVCRQAIGKSLVKFKSEPFPTGHDATWKALVDAFDRMAALIAAHVGGAAFTASALEAAAELEKLAEDGIELLRKATGVRVTVSEAGSAPIDEDEIKRIVDEKTIARAFEALSSPVAVERIQQQVDARLSQLASELSNERARAEALLDNAAKIQAASNVALESAREAEQSAKQAREHEISLKYAGPVGEYEAVYGTWELELRDTARKHGQGIAWAASLTATVLLTESFLQMTNVLPLEGFAAAASKLSIAAIGGSVVVFLGRQYSAARQMLFLVSHRHRCAKLLGTIMRLDLANEHEAEVRAKVIDRITLDPIISARVTEQRGELSLESVLPLLKATKATKPD